MREQAGNSNPLEDLYFCLTQANDIFLVEPVESALQGLKIANEESRGMEADRFMKDECTAKVDDDNGSQSKENQTGIQDKASEAEEDTEIELASGGAADETEETVQLTVEGIRTF